MVEVQLLLEKLRQESSDGLVEHDLRKHVAAAVGSVINNMVFGYRFTDDKVNSTIHTLNYENVGRSHENVGCYFK